MPVPDLDRIDPVPMRALAARQQKIDRRRDRAGTLDGFAIFERLDGFAIFERLAVVPAFRMRFQIEKLDDLRGRKHC
jgi:hypothetical protein